MSQTMKTAICHWCGTEFRPLDINSSNPFVLFVATELCPQCRFEAQMQDDEDYTEKISCRIRHGDANQQQYHQHQEDEL
jgi:hypothetical protein